MRKVDVCSQIKIFTMGLIVMGLLMHKKSFVLFFLLMSVVFSIQSYADIGVSNSIKGFAIVGQSTQVSVMGFHEAIINVEKNFTSANGQLLIKSTTPGFIATLTNERGATMQVSQLPEPHWTFGYETEIPGPIYKPGECPFIRNSLNSLTLSGVVECNFNGARGGGTVKYTRLMVGDIPLYGRARNLNLNSPPTESGIYRGSVSYTLGLGKDIDMGLDAIYHTDQIEVPIEVHVSNVPMKVKFPPGAERAVLTPQDGWANWVGRKVKPSRIYRDIPFSLMAHGAIGVSLESCSYPSGNVCQITDGNGNFAKLTISKTLPNPWVTFGGGGVNMHPVTKIRFWYNSGAVAGLVPVNSNGKLTVEVTGGELDRMLNIPGSEWSGNVTVLFEQLFEFV